MAIYDCFQYFDEDHMVDLRLNILNQYVDYFVISESTKTHQGENKKINFDIKKFSKFKDKIKFIVADYSKEINFKKHIGGESPIEQHQRNSLIKGIEDASSEDLIILSDSDEIPDLTKLDEINNNKKLPVIYKIINFCITIVVITHIFWFLCRRVYVYFF